MDSPLIAFPIGVLVGISVLLISKRLPFAHSFLRKLCVRTWRLLCWPLYRWLGWLCEMSPPTNALWASGDQFDGVEEGNFVSVRAVVHSQRTDWQSDGKQFGWQLGLMIGSERIVCFFPKDYKKTNARYLRRLKGSDRVVIHGKVTSLGDFHCPYKNDWLKLTINVCHVVGAWKMVKTDQWLRIAGWKEAQVALASPPSATMWFRLGRWCGRLL